MNHNQEQFLHLCLVEQIDYKTISQKLNVPRATLTAWYEELKAERIKIAQIRNLWTRRKIKVPFGEFYKWYMSHHEKCGYCDITEKEIQQLLDNGQLATKRLATRGKKLELDRKNPNQEYDDLENLVFACYWCNNAKTDTFTSEEFMQVGQVFKNIWKVRLSK